MQTRNVITARLNERLRQEVEEDNIPPSQEDLSTYNPDLESFEDIEVDGK